MEQKFRIRATNNDFKEEMEERIMSKGFSDIKEGDIVVVYDEYGHDYEEHYFKVESIGYDDEYISKQNPKGMRCYGIDLDCWNEEEKDFDTDDYFGVVTEGNFVRFK